MISGICVGPKGRAMSELIDAYMHCHPFIAFCAVIAACVVVVGAEVVALKFAHRWVDRWLGP